MNKTCDFAKHIGHIISSKLGLSSATTQVAIPQPQQMREDFPLSSVHRLDLLHPPIQLRGRADQEGGRKESWQRAWANGLQKIDTESDSSFVIIGQRKGFGCGFAATGIRVSETLLQSTRGHQRSLLLRHDHIISLPVACEKPINSSQTDRLLPATQSLHLAWILKHQSRSHKNQSWG
jgi:hypothetical protein